MGGNLMADFLGELIGECEAIRAVFGEGCPDTHINNTKSFIGHAMGAAGSLELVGNLPSFDDGVVHATINVDELDPELGDAPIVRARIDNAKVRTAMSNSFGFGGTNATLVFQRYGD